MQVEDSVAVVTGGTGLLGGHVSELRSAVAQVLADGRRDYDLQDRRQVWSMLRDTRPDAPIHSGERAWIGGTDSSRRASSTRTRSWVSN